MTRALAWKPRWASIRRTNSSAVSTLEDSRAPDRMVPALPEPGDWIWGMPEFGDSTNRLLPSRSRPAGLAKVAIASWSMT